MGSLRSVVAAAGSFELQGVWETAELSQPKPVKP